MDSGITEVGSLLFW